jgi:hypothetical protein
VQGAEEGAAVAGVVPVPKTAAISAATKATLYMKAHPAAVAAAASGAVAEGRGLGDEAAITLVGKAVRMQQQQQHTLAPPTQLEMPAAAANAAAGYMRLQLPPFLPAAAAVTAQHT